MAEGHIEVCNSCVHALQSSRVADTSSKYTISLVGKKTHTSCRIDVSYVCVDMRYRQAECMHVNGPFLEALQTKQQNINARRIQRQNPVT